MSQKQRDRLKVLHEVVQGKLKQTEAAEQLELSTRQVRHLAKKWAIAQWCIDFRDADPIARSAPTSQGRV